MTAYDNPIRRRRWLWIALAILSSVGLVCGAAYLYRDTVQNEWAIRQFRQAAAADDPELPRLRDRLLARDENAELAVRLADDPDPKVRAAAVDVLLANQPLAAKRDAGEPPAVDGLFNSWRASAQEAFERLLRDSDETVRRKALIAVSERGTAEVFRSQLTEALKTGPVEEQCIVAEHLAHWNGPLVIEVIGDPNKPAAVRAAAMRGLDKYGDGTVAGRGAELRTALVGALGSENPELCRTAVTTLRYAANAAHAWLDLLCDDRQKEYHPLVLRTWIDVLGNEGQHGQHWFETHDAWFRSDTSAFRCAVAGYVMCEGATIQIRYLERSPPIAEVAAMMDRGGPVRRAFDVQLKRLGNVLSVVSAIRWHCATIEKPPVLGAWLPNEVPNGAPPTRNLHAYLFQRVKPIWAWCLKHDGAYATQFLTANNIVRRYSANPVPNPIPVRPLGAVLAELMLTQTEFDRLRAQCEAK